MSFGAAAPTARYGCRVVEVCDTQYRRALGIDICYLACATGGENKRNPLSDSFLPSPTPCPLPVLLLSLSTHCLSLSLGFFFRVRLLFSFSLDGALRIDLLMTYPPFSRAPRNCSIVSSRSSKHQIPSDSIFHVANPLGTLQRCAAAGDLAQERRTNFTPRNLRNRSHRSAARPNQPPPRR